MKIAGGALLNEDLSFRTLVKRARFGAFPDLNAARRALLETQGMPRCDLGDFGRGGVTVRRAMLASLLAAWDAGGELPGNTGVLGWNGDGCTAENLAFWNDYAGNGRTAGRGGLFVATLPTIPYCEAAIALGCRGSVAYLRTTPSTTELWAALDAAAPGTYLCGEITREKAAMLLVDNREVADDLPEAPTLAALFGILEGAR